MEIVILSAWDFFVCHSERSEEPLYSSCSADNFPRSDRKARPLSDASRSFIARGAVEGPAVAIAVAVAFLLSSRRDLLLQLPSLSKSKTLSS